MPDNLHFAMSPAIHPHAHHFSRRSLLAVAVCTALLCTSHVVLFAAATNRPTAKGPTDRYLLIVETSAAMARNAQNTQRLVSQLMTSGMVGQTRPGDTIGLWTFNEELQTGGFPLQRWTPQSRERIASATAQFLAQHRYEKQSRFDKVLEPLTGVVEESERITVILLTDGSQKISGTPYDQEINESYQLNYEEQRKQSLPFITVLRARRGEYIGWRVNTLPFRPEFPPFPVEPKSDEPPVATTESKPEPPPTPVPSLVVIGEKPAPVAPASTNVPPAKAQPLVAQPPVTPDQLPQPQPDPPPPPPVETPKTVPTETPVAVKPVEPPASEPQPTTPPRVVTPSEIEPSPTTPASEPDVPTQTVQTAVATPAASWFNRTNLMVAGAVLLMAGIGLIYLLKRRAAQPAGKASLITRSMDRDQK